MFILDNGGWDNS